MHVTVYLLKWVTRKKNVQDREDLDESMNK